MSQGYVVAEPIRLSGDWQFQLDPQGELDVNAIQPDRTIPVPMPWQAAFPELRQYSGYAWYRREIELDEAFVRNEVRLHFGAVDYWCQVFVNGTLVGEHEGGYTPFAFSIGRHVRAGTNTLALRVYDSAQAALVTERWRDPARERQQASGGPPFDAHHIPHGKQEWYINVGGIWQDVTLSAVPNTFVEHIRVTPDIITGMATIDVRLGGDLHGLSAAPLMITILDGDQDVARAEVPVEGGRANYQVALQIPEVRLWSLDDPHLYHAQARLDNGEMPSIHTVRFGMRSFTTRNGQFLLNGDPIYLLSALDQDLYPDTIYTVPSEEYLRDEFRKAKELGLNTLRCHIKPPDPLYLDLADEMGLLVWSEVPSWRTFWVRSTLLPEQLINPEDVKARVEETLEAIIDRDFNHPSLVIWTLVNEDWGTSLALNPDDRAWVTQLYDRCKQLDPTRLAVDNSACTATWGPNIHVKSDLDDFHIYTAIPDQARAWMRTIEQFAMRPMWTYSAYGDAQRRGDEPLVLSEFGNWGLPSLKALRQHHGGEPPWFDLGPWWSRWEGEPGWPMRVEERFQALGLSDFWPDYEAFATATQTHQYEAMKLEIEAMRRQPSIAGYVITELTDAYWESNGLLDFARNPKVYHEQFRMINSPDVIVPYPRRRAYWEDERADIRLSISHFSGRVRDGSTLHWRVEDTDIVGEHTVPPLVAGSTQQLGALRFQLPAGDSTRTMHIQFALRGPDGVELARNVLDLQTYPRAARQAPVDEVVTVIARERQAPLIPHAPTLLDPSSLGGYDVPQGEGMDPERTATAEDSYAPLDTLLERAGYQTTEELDLGIRLAISNYPTPELLQWVRDGGDLLFISEGYSPFFWVQSRSAAYSGNWITSYSWLRPEAHPRLPHSNPLGLAFTNLMPQSTILGLPMGDPSVQRDFLAGMVSGWIHHPAAHTVQFRYGRGRVVMTTFRLRSALGYDPTAVAMLHDLVEHLHSDRCQPTLKANF